MSSEAGAVDDEEFIEDEPAFRPRGRRAWAPDADAETAALLRQLALTPWLVGGRHDEQIAAVRRNETAIRSALARLGWVLVVERDLVRLSKSPPPRPEQWATLGPSPLVCSWFFLLVAAAESMAPRVGLGQLVVAARAAAAEAALAVTGDIHERRAIVAALRQLDDRGVVESIDGDLDGYVEDEEAPVLLAVHHTRLAHVVANPGTIDPASDPARWLAQAHREDDPARRMRRRLVDDTCVHSAELDDAEAQWLSQRVRGDDGAPLAMAFGLGLERRSEGAAFVVPDDAFRYPRELGPLRFPMPGTVAHAALLLCDRAAAGGRTDVGPGPGWRVMTESDVITALAGFAGENARGRGGWVAELVDDPERLAREVGALLEGLNLLRRTPVVGDEAGTDAANATGTAWMFAPVTGRWAEAGSATPRPVSERTPRPNPRRAQTPRPPSMLDLSGEPDLSGDDPQ